MKKLITVIMAMLLLCGPISSAMASEPLYYSVSPSRIELDAGGMAVIEIVVEGSVAYAGMQFELIPGPEAVFALDAREAAAEENAIYIRSVTYNQGSSGNRSAPQHSFDGQSVFFHIADTEMNSFSDTMVCTLTVSYAGSAEVSFIIKEIKQETIFGTGDVNETVSNLSQTITLLPLGGSGNGDDGGGSGTGGGNTSGDDVTNIDDGDVPLAPIPEIELSDISGHWAYEYIIRAVERGFVNGMPDGAFLPNANVTRSQCVKMIVEAFGLTAENPMDFSDTSEHWAAGYIGIAAAHGIVVGVGENRFDPDQPITRQDMAVIISRVCGYLEESPLPVREAETFLDGDSIRDYARDAVLLLQRADIITGSEGMFRPFDNASRAECVKVILLTLESLDS